MRILEIIQVRFVGDSLEVLGGQIKRSTEATTKSTEVVTIYRQVGLETDLAVHIRHEVSDARRPSELGLRLASALKSHGLVEHTVWEELQGT